MSTKTRHVEIVQPVLKFTDTCTNKFSFRFLLEKINDYSYISKGKIYDFKIYEQTEEYIIGLIITTLDKEIPPSRDKNTKVFSPLAINPSTHGLAFGNIFYYDITREILIYEINKNGCYLDCFKELTYNFWHKHPDLNLSSFDLHFAVVLRQDEYIRMGKLDYIKTFTIEISNPTEVMNCFERKNCSLSENLIKAQINAGSQNNANFVTIEQCAISKKLNPKGLSKPLTKSMIDIIINRIIKSDRRKHVEKIKVSGYTIDTDDRKLNHIDILHDTFNETFFIPSIQIHSDVQERDRIEGIKKVFIRIKPELIKIYGK